MSRGVLFKPTEAMKFLNSLPLGAKGQDSFLGEDLRFWSLRAGVWIC